MHILEAAKRIIGWLDAEQFLHARIPRVGQFGERQVTG